MKRKIAYTIFVLVSILAATNLMADKGGIAGETASPGETNCTDCHDSFTLNSGGGSVTITDNIPAEGYSAGTTYTITVTVSKASVPLFGFDFEALASTSKSAGTLIVTSIATTQLLSATNGRRNITHKENGGLSTGSHAFSFNWTAPVTGTGNVTFYTAGVAANNNDKSTGDYVYTTTLTVTPFLNTLATGNIGATSFCSGQTGLSIPFTATGTYTAGNVFTAQLSNSTGSFTSPVTIGTLTSVTSGTIISTVPLPAVAGSLYRIRVIAGTPALTGTDNGTNLTINLPPDSANAGTAQSVCAVNATLAGNTPVIGTGVWNLSSGAGTISAPSNPQSIVTGLAAGDNTFTWTISNGTCTPSSSSVIITRALPPTVANAGPNQSVCGTGATLSGNTPAIGAGSWQLVSGAGTIADTTNPLSAVSNLGAGANVFTWTISNSVCAPSIDTVVVKSALPPSVAVAGPDQIACFGSTLLTANTPDTGMGLWALVSGSGIITDVTNPNSPVNNLGTGANTFTWTISNSPCSASTDTVIITRAGSITIANAGPDQVVCGGIATLAGDTPVIGAGTWSFIAGAGSITDPANPSSDVTGLGAGVNVFVWTITNGPCTPSTDTVEITSVLPPTIANAGPDQNACTTSATLSANQPLVGLGAWSIISGKAFIADSLTPTTSVTGLDTGINQFVWTISNSVCPASGDTVVIDQSGSITIANAGADQNQCLDTALLHGNTATTGTGVWSFINGTGTISNPTNPNTTVTNLGTGNNTFRWTISNGTCTPTTSDVVIHNCLIPNTITTGRVSSSLFCSITGYTLQVPFTTTGIFTGTYAAELSDSSGSFADSVIIGTGTQSPISATISSSVLEGTHYRVRVVNNSPAINGTDNGDDLSINTCGDIVTLEINGSPFCGTTSYSLLVPFASTGIYNGYFIAELSDSTGSFSNPVVIGTGSASPVSAVIPAATSKGNNYRVRVRNTNPPVVGTDNGVNLSINTCTIDSITTGVISGSPFCESTSLQVQVPFTYTGNFTGNFIAELSDNKGGFSKPVPIGSSAVSPIPATIPALTTTGLAYRIRVVDNNPSVIGADNGIDLEVNDCSALIIQDTITGSPFCSNTSYDLEVSFKIIGGLTGPFIVQLSDATGNFDNPASIGYGSNSPIAATIPFGTTSGNNYRIRLMDSNSGFTTPADGNNLSINTCNASGVNELTLNNNIVIYPNPNNGTFNLSASLNNAVHFSISILNVLGEEIMLKPDEQINPGNVLSYHLPFTDKGIYFIKIKTDNEVLVQRMIVE